MPLGRTEVLVVPNDAARELSHGPGPRVARFDGRSKVGYFLVFLLVVIDGFPGASK